MKRRLDHRGVTQVELIVGIVIVGVLAAVAMPRFIGKDSIDTRAFHDDAQAVIRYAQKTAIAWRRPVYVCLGAPSVRAGTATGCGTLLTHPATGAGLAAAIPSAITLNTTPSTGEFFFDGIGRPSVAGLTIDLTSTAAGDPARRIVIEAETGYVHP
jgi:MSHA pilin protein MshC